MWREHAPAKAQQQLKDESPPAVRPSPSSSRSSRPRPRRISTISSWWSRHDPNCCCIARDRLDGLVRARRPPRCQPADLDFASTSTSNKAATAAAPDGSASDCTNTSVDENTARGGAERTGRGRGCPCMIRNIRLAVGAAAVCAEGQRQVGHGVLGGDICTVTARRLHDKDFQGLGRDGESGDAAGSN
ncbi:hypothetical protein FB451DRAFT_1174007 [Mycena latifolia]|nr:hypothetical protein FB451DRAFT_1174007 [Mycena latifolia]